jgi:glycosyltransferase involved in cell wall biosynthesis
MRIAQVSPLFESVPPKLYGGTERVASFLTEELVRLGHEVTLFASGDSRTAARLISPCPRSLRLDSGCLDQWSHHFIMLDQVMERAEEFDLIHFHIDYLHYPLSRRCPTPHVTTLHGRLDLPDLQPLYRRFQDIPVISISNAQRKPLPWINWQGTVLHGLPIDLYRYHPQGGEYLAFLGRISSEKRLDRAIEISRRCGMKLKIAAKVDAADRKYYEEVIRPLLSTPGVEYLGEIGEEQKHDFLGNAKALLFPIDWPEPFGLVMIESMACGTPVIAWRCGSVPEVITEGVTGYVCDSIDQAVEAVRRCSNLNRLRCRQTFENRFCAARMAQEYLRIYHRLILQTRVAEVADDGRDYSRSGPVLHSRDVVPG